MDIEKRFSGEEAQEITYALCNAYSVLRSPQDYLGLYIHIPFCQAQCDFCPYYQWTISSDLRIQEQWVDELIDDIQLIGKALQQTPVHNIVFGGGTPSLLSSKQLHRILDAVYTYTNPTHDRSDEKSFEIHPSHVTPEHIEVLAEFGIHRLSIGVQSLSPTTLACENREYVPLSKIQQIIDLAHQHTLQVSCDLLLALKSQTAEQVHQEVLDLVAAGSDQVQVYRYRWLPVLPEGRTPTHIQQEQLRYIAEKLQTTLAQGYGVYGDPEQGDNIIIRHESMVGYAHGYVPTPLFPFHQNIIGVTLGRHSEWSSVPALRPQPFAISSFPILGLRATWSQMDELLLMLFDPEMNPSPTG